VHHVGKLASNAPAAGGVYLGRSEGYARFPIAGRESGALHQAVAIVELGPEGHVGRHAHAFEEGIYLLEGSLTLSLAGSVEELAADDTCFVEKGVTHELENSSSERARWLELHAPQPGAQGLEDTVFPEEDLAGEAPVLAYRRGRFDEGELPPPSSALGLAGFGEANVGGASLEMLIDRDFGASQFNLFVVQYGPGGFIKEHDHPFEEAFLFLSGEIEALLDGVTYTLGAGDYCWSGVGSMHALTNRGDAPVRWIETQVPQPPTRHQARFKADWARATRAVLPA
jgi:quercetin dioxygenase-like cupin family protein